MTDQLSLDRAANQSAHSAQYAAYDENVDSLRMLLDHVGSHGSLSDGEYLDGPCRILDACSSPRKPTFPPSLPSERNLDSNEFDVRLNNKAQSSDQLSAGFWNNFNLDESFTKSPPHRPIPEQDDYAENLPDLIFGNMRIYHRSNEGQNLDVPQPVQQVCRSEDPADEQDPLADIVERGIQQSASDTPHFSHSSDTTGSRTVRFPEPEESSREAGSSQAPGAVEVSPVQRAVNIILAADRVDPDGVICISCGHDPAQATVSNLSNSSTSFNPPTPYPKLLGDLSNRDIHIRITQVLDELRILNLALARRMQAPADEEESEIESPPASAEPTSSNSFYLRSALGA